LVLNLDAINPNSYPQSGTIWYDTSGYGNNGTLINGTAWTPNGSQTSFSFDGVDDKVTISSLFTGNPSLSIEFWFYTTSTGTPVLLGTTSTGLSLLTYADLGPSRNFRVGVYGDDYLVLMNGSLTSSTWYHIIITHDQVTTKGYVNGVFNNSALRTLNIGSTGTFIGAADSIQYFTGKIPQFRLYNRALTAQEVLQNYNALKTRFGLS
jgi:hypothetical protein